MSQAERRTAGEIMAREPWVSIEQVGHDICIKGGEVTATVTRWLDNSGEDFELEEADTDAFNLRFKPHYRVGHVNGLAVYIKCRLTELGYQVTNPRTMTVQDVCTEIAA